MRKFLAFCLPIILFTSCGDLTEVNVDPAQVSDVPPSQILPAALNDAFFHEGLNGNRVAGILMNYYNGSDGCLQVTQYNITAQELDLYWQSTFTDLGGNSQTLIEMGLEKSAPIYTAIGKILKANMFGQMTSFFGQLPFSESLQGNTYRQPTFDRQETIYLGIQQLLDEAIETLSLQESGYIGGDLVYQGDAQAWAKLAHGLKARFYMHTEKQDPQALEVALEHLRLSLQSVSEEPILKFEANTNSNWALAKFGRARPGTLRIHGKFYNRLAANQDPRIDKYAGTYVSETDAYEFYEQGNSSLYWAQDDSQIPLLTYAELRFIEAEILLRQGGQAHTALESAIRANMEVLEIDNAEADTYISNRANLNGLTAQESLERIMEEAYFSYYGHNFHEAYVNYRRTGYPVLVPNDVQATPFNPTGGIPQRYTYPAHVRSVNSENLRLAISQQGGDVNDLPLWTFRD